MKIKNAFGTRFSGTVGKSLIASSWKGKEYVKAYAKPSNPRSEEQKRIRGIFNQALKAWRELRPRQKEFYGKIAKDVSGYNLFVSRYIKAVRAGLGPEWPLEMHWTTEGGKAVEDGWLIVQWRSKDIFVDCLEDAKGEVALTPSDAPYVFVLKKGKKEETVLKITDLGETDVPMILESKTLGIRLIADVQTPPSLDDGGKS